MKTLSITNDIAERKPFRQINVQTTYFRLAFKPCETCGKEGVILAGLPTHLPVTIPMTDEEFQIVANKPFWIAGDFEITCINGYSHIVKNLAPTMKWLISTEQNPDDGYKEIGVGFEQTLANFIPNFAEMHNKTRVASSIDRAVASRANG